MASYYDRDDAACMHRHEDLPQLLKIASTLKKKKEEIFENNGIRWRSKQRRPANNLSVAEWQKSAVRLAKRARDATQRLQPSVGRGRFPTTDSLMDDALKSLRKELTDVTAFQEANGTSPTAGVTFPNGGTAAASLTAVAVAGESTSRKRSNSRGIEAVAAKKKSKGVEIARARLAASTSGRASVDVDRSRSSDQNVTIASPSRTGPCKWQIDKLMDWMKANDYNPRPDWTGIADLVESTRMKPSEVANWAREFGGVVANLRLSVDMQHDALSVDNDDTDSIPELAEEEQEDACKRKGTAPYDKTGPPTAMPREFLGNDTGINVDSDLDMLKDLEPELGFKFGLEDLDAYDNLHLHSPRGHELNVVALGSSGDDDLFGDFGFQLDFWCGDVDGDDEKGLHRPSKRQRCDLSDGAVVRMD